MRGGGKCSEFVDCLSPVKALRSNITKQHCANRRKSIRRLLASRLDSWVMNTRRIKSWHLLRAYRMLGLAFCALLLMTVTLPTSLEARATVIIPISEVRKLMHKEVPGPT